MARSFRRGSGQVARGIHRIIKVGKRSASISLQGVSNVVRPADSTTSWALNFRLALLFH